MNLFSAALKSSINSSVDDLHESLSRPIQIINEVANAVINDNDDNYNAFSDKKDPDITYTANIVEIPARIKWLDKADGDTQLIFAGGGGDKSGGASIFLGNNYGVARIKVKKQYNDLVAGATKIIVDGYDCAIYNIDTQQSIFDLNYSIFYLVRQK